MRGASLLRLLGRDLRRDGSALAVAGFGIAAGTAALAFFLALGLGVRKALIGRVFVVDQIELQPKKGADPGMVGLLLGAQTPAIPPATVDVLAKVKGVLHVYPKLRFAFPASAKGGKEALGRDVGTSELPGDGIDPALVAPELTPPGVFHDPLEHPGPACVEDKTCPAHQYCEKPSDAVLGACSDPVPVLVSPYLVALFDKAIAPAHGLAPIGRSAIEQASKATFVMKVGESVFGRSKTGAARAMKVKIVGLSLRALDLGATLPLPVVRRLNREYAGEASVTAFSSVLVQVADGGRLAEVVRVGEGLGLEPKDTRARDVAVLITAITALLSLVAAVMLTLAGANIAGTFRTLSLSRRREIALYRALGASQTDVQTWLLALAASIGLAGGLSGLVAARALAAIADWLARTRLPDFPFKPETFFAFPASIALSALGVAVAFALLGAVGPARRSAKVDPARALAGG